MRTMVRNVNQYFFGEDSIEGADWTDKAVYYGFPAVAAVAIALPFFL